MNNSQKYCFFWGMSSIYSNFYPHKFNLVINEQNLEFVCSEQAFMYMKAIYFKDQDSANKILNFHKHGELNKLCRKYSSEEIVNSRSLSYKWTAEINKIKQLGRKVKNYNDSWDSVRYQVMKKILKAKFHKFGLGLDMMKEKRLFVEASPYDKIWGIGLSEFDANITDLSKWKGQNLLGKCLNEVRKELFDEKV